jgi:hypothetical protein
VGYRRQTRRTGEVRSRARALPEVRRALSGAVDRLLFRSQAERGVFHFILATLRRSPMHKVRLAGSLAFSLATLFLIVGLPRTNWTSPAAAGLNVLGAPLALGFFLLLGFLSVFNVPFSAEANWAFRLTEQPDRRPYFVAVKKLVAVCLLLPLAAVVFLIHARLWGPGQALLHTLYVLAWISLLAEVVLWKYARIPFACQVVPGKAKVHMRWLPYAFLFVFVFSLVTLLETALFRNPVGFTAFLVVMAAIIAGLEVVHRRFVYPKLAIVYEEEPEPVMVTL